MIRKILNDKQWAQIEQLLPGKASDRGITAGDNRKFVEAVLWIARTGSAWRDLPEELGHWHRVYVGYSRWAKSGVWKRMFEVLSNDPALEQLMIDGSIVRVHQHGASKKKRGIASSKAKAVAD